MKKLIATAILASLTSVATYAQGTVNFANAGVGLNAPVTLSDGTTKLGATFQAMLLAGPTSTSLAAVGTATSFLAAAPGYFNGGSTTISTVAPGASGFFEVVAWDPTLNGTTTGATAAQAFSYWQAGHGNVWGASFYNYQTGAETPFSTATGGVGNPPTAPTSLTGLQAFSLAPPIPEPSTFALAGLGAAALMIFRRRK